MYTGEKIQVYTFINFTKKGFTHEGCLKGNPVNSGRVSQPDVGGATRVTEAATSGARRVPPWCCFVVALLARLENVYPTFFSMQCMSALLVLRSQKRLSSVNLGA